MLLMIIYIWNNIKTHSFSGLSLIISLTIQTLGIECQYSFQVSLLRLEKVNACAMLYAIAYNYKNILLSHSLYLVPIVNFLLRSLFNTKDHQRLMSISIVSIVSDLTPGVVKFKWMAFIQHFHCKHFIVCLSFRHSHTHLSREATMHELALSSGAV